MLGALYTLMFVCTNAFLGDVLPMVTAQILAELPTWVPKLIALQQKRWSTVRMGIWIVRGACTCIDAFLNPRGYSDNGQ